MASDAQIAYVKQAAHQDKTPGTTIGWPITVAAGNSILVAFAMDDVTGMPNIVDDTGATYTLVAQITNATHVRAFLFAALRVVGGTHNIIVEHPLVTARAGILIEITGIGTVDQSAVGTGTGISMSSTNTVFTKRPDEIVIGVYGMEGPQSDSCLSGSGYNSIASWGTLGGVDDTNINVFANWGIFNFTGQFAATGEISTARSWAAITATFYGADEGGTVGSLMGIVGANRVYQ